MDRGSLAIEAEHMRRRHHGALCILYTCYLRKTSFSPSLSLCLFDEKITHFADTRSLRMTICNLGAAVHKSANFLRNALFVVHCKDDLG